MTKELTFGEISNLAFVTKYWQPAEVGIVVNNAYLAEFVNACIRFANGEYND